MRDLFEKISLTYTKQDNKTRSYKKKIRIISNSLMIYAFHFLQYYK